MKIQLDKFNTVPAGQVISVRSQVGVREITFKFRAADAVINYRPIGEKDWRFFARVENDHVLTVFADNIEIVSDVAYELQVSEGESLEYETFGDSFVMQMSRNTLDPVQERMMQMIRLQQMEMAGVMESIKQERITLKKEIEEVNLDAIRARIAGDAIAAASSNPVEPAIADPAAALEPAT